MRFDGSIQVMALAITVVSMRLSICRLAQLSGVVVWLHHNLVVVHAGTAIIWRLQLDQQQHYATHILARTQWGLMLQICQATIAQVSVSFGSTFGLFVCFDELKTALSAYCSVHWSSPADSSNGLVSSIGKPTVASIGRIRLQELAGGCICMRQVSAMKEKRDASKTKGIYFYIFMQIALLVMIPSQCLCV